MPVAARTTGVRAAKAQLSKLLRDVQRGREWVITDRGRPVARLVPVARGLLPLPERVRRLEESGVIEPAPPGPRTLPRPLAHKDELAQAWLREDRDR